MIADNDKSSELKEQVAAALKQQQPLALIGSGSKAFYGNASESTFQELHLKHHTGIIAYQANEAFISARAGTPIHVIETLLANNGQMLAFEPPRFSADSTIGGIVAAGLSGPARTWRGSVRDHILGCTILTGYSKINRFGGQTMNNVAGYDIARLMAGSMGTLGVLLDITLKVVPRPANERTITLEMPSTEAYDLLTALNRSTAPLSASCYFDGCLYLRLSGEPRHVLTAHHKIGGDPLTEGDEFWTALRDQTHEFFQQYDRPLWRMSFPPNTQMVSNLEGNSLIEWGGSQRWIYTNIPVNLIRSIATKGQGHATLYRGRLPGVGTFHPLEPAMAKVQRKLKQAMDPQGIFNPSRLYRDW